MLDFLQCVASSTVLSLLRSILPLRRQTMSYQKQTIPPGCSMFRVNTHCDPNPHLESPTLNANIPNPHFEQPRGRGVRLENPWNPNMATFRAIPVDKKRSTDTSPQSFETPRSARSVLNFRQLLTPQTPSNASPLIPCVPHNASSALPSVSPPNMLGLSLDSPDHHFGNLHQDLSRFVGPAGSNTPSLPPHLSEPPVSIYDSFLHVEDVSSPLLSPVPLNSAVRTAHSTQGKENRPRLGSSPTAAIPRSRRKYLSRMDVVDNILAMLRDARMSLPDFLVLVLDDSQSAFSTAFFVEGNSDQFHEILDVIWRNKKGGHSMKEWLGSRAIDLVCDIIHDEMDSAKPQLRMTTANITSDFISGWDINALMEPVASHFTPVWSRILEAATESKETNAKPNSRNRQTVRNHISLYNN